MQAKSASNVKGIDVSKYQGVIDWAAVKADGVKFGFIKASEGRTYQDPKFRTCAADAITSGVPVGFYHYARPENNDPLSEAVNFANTVKNLKATFPHVLDVEGDEMGKEIGAGKLSAWCFAWLQEVERLTGHPTMVYTGANFAKNYLGSQLAKWPLWVAHYGATTPMANSTWDKWSVFQYTSTGSVKGIAGNVDMNAMEETFFKKYVPPEEDEYMMKAEDANAMIKLLSAAYMIVGNEHGKELNRLANELRKASGQKTQ